MSEKRDFKVDERILFDLVFKQSHSIYGALKELVQNSFDAGATSLDIVIDEHGFTAEDNGKGFQTREEITQFFEIFGLPHEHQSESRFGRFRMGRGQIMGYASTVWRSGKFQMDVDIKYRGINYILSELPTPVNGCSIAGRWYEIEGEEKGNELVRRWQDGTIETQVKECIKYLVDSCKYIYGMNIRINGKHINNHQQQDWDFEDDTFLFKKTEDGAFSWNQKAIRLYNLGILASRFNIPNIHGVVVTKRHLSMNMTRSDVQESCPVYQHIRRTLKGLAPKYDENKKYQPHQSRSIIVELYDAHLSVDEVMDLKLFKDLRGTHYYTLRDLLFTPFFISSGDKKSDFVADTVHVQGKCIALNKEFEYYGYFELDDNGHISSVPFSELLNIAYPSTFSALHNNYLSEEEALAMANVQQIELPTSELNSHENCKLKALNSIAYDIALAFTENKVKNYRGWDTVEHVRSFTVGLSKDSDAWTDCKTRITIERSILDKMDKGMEGAISIITIIAHEYAHIEDDNEHNFAFYKRVHDFLVGKDIILGLAKKLLVKYDDKLAQAKLKPTKGVIKAMRAFRRNGLSKTESSKAIK